jgi:O-antigen ligase
VTSKPAIHPLVQRLFAFVNGPVACRYAFLTVLALAMSVPYAIPPLIEWLLGRDPARIVALERPVDNMHFMIAVAGAAMFFGAFAVLACFPPERLPRNGIVPLVAASGIAVLASSLLHAGFDFNPRTLLLPTSFGLVFFCTILAAPTVRQIRAAVLLLPLITVPVCIYALAQAQGIEILNYSRVAPGTGEELTFKQMVASTFGHPNYLASFLVPVFPLTVCMAVAPGGVLRRGVGAVCVAAIAAGMLAGGTRGAWLATLIAAIPFYLVTILSPQYRRPLLFTGGLVLVVIALVLLIPNPFLKVRFDVLDRLLASKEIIARFYYWTIALHLWQESPLFGIGYGNYNVLFWPAVAEFQLKPGSEYYQFVLAETIRGVPPQYVHNDHLQILAEGGILGAGLWLALWSVLLVQLYETALRVRNNAVDLLLVAGFSSSFMAVAVDSFTNFPLHIPASGLLFYLILALWVVWRSHRTGEWYQANRYPPPPRPADALVPELPRVRPKQVLR